MKMEDEIEEVKKSIIDNEKEHVVRILEEALSSIENNNIEKIKEISNETIHSASIHQDKVSINLAIVLYSSSKLMERVKNRSQLRGISALIKKMLQSLKEDKKERFEKELEGLIRLINNLDRKFAKYVEDVLSQAKVRKGAQIYRHGISLGQVADILDVSLWDLMSYIGNAKIVEDIESKIGPVERLKIAEETFK
ncbi:MAG: hypothetical protein PWQ28_220 [Candidatus Woesearchaeota archaeon]|nr:hypothetical protein [Candidatus Woesearchaeota archaeon]MDK2907547.1 hypothetical protein [Candidatus Woesearchaeota archaeon]